MASSSSTNDSNLLYIYDLKYNERKRLCDILDQHDKWEELGGTYMEYDVGTLEKIKLNSRWCQRSPTNQLLTLWGEQNHTVLELFILLSQMHHYRAMLILKPLVDEKFHVLIKRGEENLNEIIAKIGEKQNQSGSAGSSQPVEKENTNCESKKDMKIGTHNLNKQSKEPSTPEKLVLLSMESDIENDSPSKLQDTVKPSERKKSKGPHENKDNRGPLENQDAINLQEKKNNKDPLENESRVGQENNESKGPAETQGDLVETQRKLSNASSISSSVETCTPLINFNELEIATNGWDKNLILGRGGFGTVYKGLWKNTPVAIKKLEIQDAASENFLLAQQQQSLREIKYLNQFRHDNILPLYGYSFGGDCPCLVYQCMENGSLEDRLQCRRGTAPLSWALRCSIATGVARGLQFLHYRKSPISSKPLIHGDIKSANILLDPSFVPKIGDFGLAREGPPEKYTHLTISKVHGTRPYLPADFLRFKKFSTKVDTYSFGIVLFEIATGLRAYEESRSKKFLGDYVKHYDEERLDELADLKAGVDTGRISYGLLSIGKRCVADVARARPEMDVVHDQLKDLTNLFEQSLRAHYMLRQNSLSPTTPYAIQLYYDHISHQRRSSIPNSTAIAVGTSGSIDLKRMPPQPVHLHMVQGSLMVNNPHIRVTPPSVGVQLQNSNNPPNQDTSRNTVNGLPPSSCASPCVTSPADDLPLLSELGVSTPN